MVKTPTDAPNAKTRAFAASIDFVNSSALPVILPKGCDSISMLFALFPKLTPRLLPAFFAAASMLASNPICLTGTSNGMIP